MGWITRCLAARVLTMLGIILCLALGCETGVVHEVHPPPPMPDDMPDDFYVKSEYFGASLPPQYHYDYYIVLDCAVTDTISFHPDYEDSGPPIWVETFDVADNDLESLYDMMRENDIFRDHWTPIGDTLLGAATRSLRATADDRQFYVPRLVEDTAAVNPVFLTVDSLVPGAVWDTLWARRDRYIEDYP